jgi:hypothetical protein
MVFWETDAERRVIHSSVPSPIESGQLLPVCVYYAPLFFARVFSAWKHDTVIPVV